MPTFEIALVWSSAERAHEATRFVVGLEQHVPRTSLTRLEIMPGQSVAVLAFEADFSIYQEALVRDLSTGAKRCGGRLVEVLRLNSRVREEFRRQFLQGTGTPFPCASYEEAATILAQRLAALPSCPGQDAPKQDAPHTPTRRDQRHEVQLVVEFKTNAAFVAEYASNISKGGIFVRTSERPQPNTYVELRLHLPDGRDLTTSARVVHVFEHPEHGGVGLAFENRYPAFQKALAEYCASLA